MALRGVVLVAGLAWLALAGAAGAAPRGPLAIVIPETASPILFTRVDPVSLRPVGPNIDLGEFHGGWSFSPDGRLIAFGIQARTGIQVVDPVHFTTVRTIPQSVFAGAVAWLRPHRLVTMVADFLPTLVDPLAGRTLRRLPGTSCVARYGSTSTAVTRHELVWYTRTALVTARADGRVRVARLGHDTGSCERKGVATQGRRGWLVGPTRVVEVDLRSMRVTGRVMAAGPSGSVTVSVVPVGSHRVATAYATRGFYPVGVEIADTARGVRRVVDAAGGAARFARGRLIVFDGGYPSQSHPAHLGVRVYDSHGRRLLYRLARGRHVWDVQVLGGRAWAMSSGGVTSFSVRTGRVLSRDPRRLPNPVTLLAPPSS